ncbi:META domain-containing protein [Leptolyngbya cf. ectocarpi LEGE 11479]|uniref:META domain-containing protein n=1 Tax=Leptolyngbya cf. ectocarpi LEGE 11479 TaxID=1828722 RepID=A0A928ZUH0_LEPEC|nr:META domain-containing protein [Leptolyngbya ectocarpi]MBE9067678.1 META domain-containing protein [Leptolyngbya cf. ectocarpi LEGE 11479]
MTVSSDTSSSTPPLELAENNTSWQITAWEQGGTALTSLPPAEISVDLDAQQISGFSGCNSFGGSFTLADEGEITIGPLRSTQRGCDQAVMEQETQFLEAMQSVNQIRAEENQLILSYTANQTENTLYFSRM